MIDLEAALQETMAAIERTYREAEALQQDLALLEEERKGLELAIRRRRGSIHTDEMTITDSVAATVTSPTTPYWRSLGRGEAVLQVLRANPLPIGPREIVKYLEGTGREGDTYNLVSAGLNHLKNKGLAETVARGQWVAVSVSPNGDRQQERIG